MPTRSCSAFSSSLSERRSFASSAPSGSSSSSTAGLSTSARASAIRCCCPPDSWPGRRLANSVILTSSRASFTPAAELGLAHPVVSQPEGHVVEDGQEREQRVALEHRVDVAPVRRHVGHVDAVEQDPPGGRLL